MIAAGVFVLGVVGALAPGFRFRLDAADAARYRDPSGSPAPGVAVVLRAAPDGSRIDLLTLANDRLPRWKWADAGFVSGGRVALHAPGGSTALLVLSAERGPAYRLDGPSLWPVEPSEREVVARPVRAVHGSSPFTGTAYEMRLAGRESAGDPLCESGAGEWQCVGVPRAFSGRIVSCRGAAVAGTAEVRPDSSAEAVVRPVTFAALLRVELSEPESSRTAPSVRVLRPRAPKDFVTRADPRSVTSAFGDGLVWIETDSAPPDAVVEVSAAAHATKRFTLRPDEVRCVEPVSVVLPPTATLRGSVIDPAGSPVPGALVLVRSAGPADAGAVLGDAETDATGEFEVSGVEPGNHRIRACHGRHGCTEEPARPGFNVVRLPGQGTFIGRVLSSAGVPQSGAAVRILPTEKTWTTADDRLTRLPLESESGADGRFRISAAENGDYLVEVRSQSSGVARVSVRRSNLSPAVTDLGDVRLPEPIEFTARVSGCVSGSLFFSGPLGGETSLPSLLRFRLDAEGRASVLLPEGGAWTAWASCSGMVEWLLPALLPDAAALAGLEVRFRRAGDGPSAATD